MPDYNIHRPMFKCWQFDLGIWEFLFIRYFQQKKKIIAFKMRKQTSVKHVTLCAKTYGRHKIIAE